MELNSNKRIIFIGPGASGKNFLIKKFEEKGYRYGVSHTTRPKRITELEGVDYYFVSKDVFENLIKENKFYEWTSFKDGEWFYGTSNEEFYKSDVFTMTPSGITKLKPEDRKNSVVIYIDTPEEIRRERLRARNDADTVERRIASDKKDFENFTDYDIKL